MHLKPSTLNQAEKKPVALAVSVIVTVLNEQATIKKLVSSLVGQSLKPTEIVIVDGGSIDQTWQLLQQLQAKHGQQLIKIFQQAGNRSVGRNLAIKQASHSLIAITDAGCVPRSDWLAELVKAYQSAEKPQTVVAGYYTAQIKTAFQQAVTPYALVMPDRVDPVNFLPATRSMLLPKTVWKKLGGFDRRFSDNEDYDFARRLRRQKNPIVFARQAQVSWQPRSNLLEFWAMIYRFARGDAQARLFRPKVAFIFIRYSLGVGILLWSWPWAAAGLVAYAGWSISKNLRHVPNGWYWLPLLQVTSDLAVMLGTVEGLMIQRD